jgi:para-aminobenzoate synthetase component 1
MDGLAANPQIHEYSLAVHGMTIQQVKEQMNTWGQQQVPFLFAVDFEMQKPWIMCLDEIDPEKIIFDINGFTNCGSPKRVDRSVTLKKQPIPLTEYKSKFDLVYDHLSYGDSYLTNLTARTPIEINLELRELFSATRAKYKLCFNDAFLVFSPETFIQIREGNIFSFPMKGTIDAGIQNAGEILLNDEKELAEHVTIVDLIRNDLSEVAEHVEVKRFRYIEEIKTNEKRLLQVSSEIIGKLPPDHMAQLGDIVTRLLPAGSVSGAPKHKTLEIIREAEKEKRGYYTGVFGYFDGKKMDSGVMIRFIEKDQGNYFYRSGGGITTQSLMEKEYQEIIDKVYVPLD